MFKKLVANLPFNPGLINQVGFYAERMRQEKSIRRLSFLFMALAMIVQSFAVISPPEKSLASSRSHLMNGLQTKADILAYYDNPSSETKAIFKHYNLTRQDILNLTDRPNARIFTNDGNDWWTVGLYSLRQRTDVKQVYKNNERAIQYRPGNYVYERQWRAFDIINSGGQHRTAWRGVSAATGQTFWIVQSCGNITWINSWKTPTPTPTPTPEPKPDPKPELDIKKSIDKKGPLNPGDTFTYRIEYRNKKGGSQAAKDVKITDEFDIKHLDVLPSSKYSVNARGFLTYNVGSLPYKEGNAYRILEVPVRLKDPLPRELEVCNTKATITASNATQATAEKVCIDIITPCPYDPSIPNINNENCTIPIVKCSLLDSVVKLNERKVTFTAEVNSSNDALVTIAGYDYDFGDGNQTAVASSEFSNSIVHTYEPGDYNASVIVRYSAPSENGITEQSVECSQPISFDEDQPIGQQKTVENITKGLKGDDAIETRVGGGDELRYTLSTLNSNNYDVTITVEDYIGDILDYADLDEELLLSDGGRYDESAQKVLWENITIPANSRVETSFQVTMKNPIPATNRPSDQGGDFDCVISNEYGDKLSLNVACPVVKGIETLPNTGPGTSLIIGTSITALAGYFFARSRLISKELAIIRKDYATTGGM